MTNCVFISHYLCHSTSDESISRVHRTWGCQHILAAETGSNSRGRRGCCTATWRKYSHTQPGHSSANSLHKGKSFLQPQKSVFWTQEWWQMKSDGILHYGDEVPQYCFIFFERAPENVNVIICYIEYIIGVKTNIFDI